LDLGFNGGLIKVKLRIGRGWLGEIGWGIKVLRFLFLEFLVWRIGEF